MVSKVATVLSSLALVACGQLDKKKSDTKAETGPQAVTFSGYVQKAFTLTVDGKQFSDSEQFYTQFIDKLVKPKYPNLTADEVTVEGAYGLDEFGASDGVYMSATSSNGHLFQAVTDAQSKFTVQVQPDALDETYEAKVVVRIGLQIAQAGSQALHYCYILYGDKIGIAISDTSKPIIFDTFSTELDTYKCEQVQDSAIVIPGVSTSTGTSTSTSTGSTTPSVVFTSVATVNTPLDSTLNGKNGLAAATMTSNGTLWLVKPLATTKADGSSCVPIVKVTGGLTNPTVTSQCVSTPNLPQGAVNGFDSVVDVQGKLILAGTYDSDKNGLIVSVGEDGSAYQAIQLDGLRQGDLLGLDGTTVKVFQHDSVSDLSLSGTPSLVNPVPAPSSNSCDIGSLATVASMSGSFAAVTAPTATGCITNQVTTVNSKLVLNKQIPVSLVDYSQTDLLSSFLVSDGTVLYIVKMSGDSVTVKKLSF